MTDWQDLIAELDLWQENAQAALFWWRDDDAITPTPALRRMLDIAQSHDAPLALAVIPKASQPALSEYLNARADVTVLQHGFNHTNHGKADEKKSEFGRHRARQSIADDLAKGRDMMSVFAHAQPILVPPWNRFNAAALPALTAIGISGISTYGPRTGAFPAPGLKAVNTHADIIDWHGTRKFVGLSQALKQILSHLQAKRQGHADSLEPTGLLSHHLVHDEACWVFIDEFLQRLNAHQSARLLNCREAWSI